MGLYFGLFVGFILGLASVAGWNFFMAIRSSSRSSKSVGLLLLGQIDNDDLKKLCHSNYPPWVSFPSFERVPIFYIYNFVEDLKLQIIHLEGQKGKTQPITCPTLTPTRGRVKWLNKLLEKIWPSVALAASELIRTNIEPQLAMYAPPGFKLSFSKLFLGNIAPQVEGVRIHTIQAGQLIMDLDFKWGGDPSIILALQTPVGAHLPVQLKNLRFFATVRVIFKLAEDLPCISGVVVALLEKPKPEIRYTLKLIGGNLNSVPGLSELIKGIVEDAVADSLQWPHRIVVPIAQPPVDLSDLQLKLQGKLTVKVVKAQNLKNAEMIGKSDPYVIAYVRVLFQSKTKVIDNNLNPVWDNEIFEFDVEDKETQSLVLQVFDKDIGTDDLLGVATYPLVKLTAEETKEIVLPLTKYLDMSNVADKRDRGHITVQVTYHIYSEEERKAAMEAEQQLISAKKAAAEGGIIGGTMDAIGGAVGGAGKLVAGGAGAVGMVGSGIGKAGKYVAKGISTSFASSWRSRRGSGIPETPK